MPAACSGHGSSGIPSERAACALLRSQKNFWPKQSLAARPSEPRRKCRSAATEGGGQHESMQGDVKRLLADDPETQSRLERVRQAAATVAALQAQKAELDRSETAANYSSAWASQDEERRQAQRAAERGADADILKAADTLEKAQADLRAALAEKNKWNSTASEDAERLESAKAGAVAAAGAALGSLPLVLSARTSWLIAAGSLGTVLVTGLLFGVTYRYAIRRDVGNSQLKGGVVAAFGLARGLALAEETLRSSADPTRLEALGTAAVSAGESMLSIGFAAAALELALKRGFVKTFSSDQ